jgi:hypothetical protein
MRVVRVRANRADFAEIFEAMAEWLDHNNCKVEQFETETGDAVSIIVKAQFADDDLAELFRREFQGKYGD